jgi:hypothetical protein
MSWIEAVKKWNKDTKQPKYKIPKKGTKEHKQVMEIKRKMVKK